jgi:hypothetical protein
MRNFRHHRARKGSRNLPSPGQFELPFEYWELSLACPARNPSRWIDRRWRPSPSRPATRRAKRVRPYTVPASSFLANVAEKVCQGHTFWLTWAKSSDMVEVNQKGWLERAAAFPTLDSGKEPELSSGRPHVGRGSRRSLQTSPLACDRRRARLPSLRLPWRVLLSHPPAVQMQGVRAPIQRHVRNDLRRPQAPYP